MRSDTIPLRGRGADGHNLLVSDALGLPGVPLATGHCPIHNWPRSASHPIVAGVAAVPEGCSRAGHGRARRRLRPQHGHGTGRDVCGFPLSSSRAAIWDVVAAPDGRSRAQRRLRPQCCHRTGRDAGGVRGFLRSSSRGAISVVAVPEGRYRSDHSRARRRLRPQRCHWTGRDARGVRGFPRNNPRASISDIVAVPEGRCRSGHGRARGRLWPQCHHRTGGDAGGVRSFGKHREAQLAEASACGDGLRDPLWSHEVEAHCTTRGAIMQGGPLLRHAQPRADHVRGPALREAGRQLSTM
mmetsp:Transcript_98950/g.265754  ORF Transcript_98950/g.265754 Transcript_98950/m.265754 type:complete len:298 (+) Transcript_98950:167-1060(+)